MSEPDFSLDDFRIKDYELPPLCGKAKPADSRSEQEICCEFERLFSPDFRLWKEVSLRHPLGTRHRIDYVGRCQKYQWDGLIGFEIKRPDFGEDQFRQFNRSLSQAIDYTHCVIESDISGEASAFHQRLRYVFLYPSPYTLYYHAPVKYAPHKDWAMGAIRLAGKYGVGVIQPACGQYHDHVFLLSGERVYELGKGPTKMKHAINERFGSAK